MGQNDVPPEVCWGKHWDANEVKCAGGLDPTYINKLDNTHRRDRCKWYQSCASRTTTSKLGAASVQQQQQVPVQPNVQQPMFRPPVSMPAPQPPAWQRPLQSIANGLMNGASTAFARNEAARVPVRVTGQPPYQPTQHQQYPQQQYSPFQYQQYPQYQQGGMAPPWAAMMPQMVPMNHQAPGTQMPAYLTVPEPVVPGVHWGYRLGYSVLRSVLKASGHTLSNFFDFTPINPWPTPPNGTNTP